MSAAVRTPADVHQQCVRFSKEPRLNINMAKRRRRSETARDSSSAAARFSIAKLESWLLARRVLLAQAFVIVAAALWVYWPALNGGFIWDDTWYITINPLLHDWSGLWKIWFSPGSWIEYYPINGTLLWIQYQLWGEHTLGYHLVSLALHITGAFLVWRLLGQFGLRLAWLGGLLFAIHPVQVQSVAWICELKNTCSLPLDVLAISAWIHFEQSGRTRDYQRAFLLFVLSMLAKITMAPFPIVMLLYAWWRRGRLGTIDFKRAAPFLVLSLALVALTHHASVVYESQGHQQDVIIPLGDPATYIARFGVLSWFYLATSIYPVDLTPVYPRWTIAANSLPAWLPLLATLVLGLWCWVKRRTWGRHVLLGLGFFGLNLFPFLGFVGISYMIDMWVELHLLYLPLLGVIGLMVAAVEDLRRKLPATLRYAPLGATAVVSVAMICGARAYAGWFTGEETFWTRTIQRNPNASLPYQDLGCYMIQMKRYPEAIENLRKGIALLPTYDFGYYNLGIALEKSGRTEEAKAEYRKAIQLNPQQAKAYLDLGELERREGALDQAEQTFRDGLKFTPDSESLAVDLAGMLLERGQVSEAVRLYDHAAELNPDIAQLQYDYGTALMKAGNLSAAGNRFANAVELDPHLAVAHQSLGAVLAQEGHLPEAIDEFKAALDIDPTLGAARNNLARALVQSDRIPDAIRELQNVLQYHPDDAQAQQNLARLRQYQQQHPPTGGSP
jgi:tetratricopeptide (TPR) repeat protein